MINFDGNCFSGFKDAPEELINTITSLPVHTHHLIAFRGKITLLEDHYFSMMAALRRSRVEIPMHFTLEFFQEQLDLLNDSNHNKVDFQKLSLKFYRKQDLTLNSIVTSICFLMQIDQTWWKTETSDMVLYKDYYIFANDYSNRFQTNASLRNLGKIFAYENGFGAALLLNAQKRLAESTHGAVFLFEHERIKTPALSEGTVDDVLRKSFINFLKNDRQIEVVETEIPVFSIQQAQEMFLISSSQGFTHINQFRKKKFKTKMFDQLLAHFLDHLKNQL